MIVVRLPCGSESMRDLENNDEEHGGEEGLRLREDAIGSRVDVAERRVEEHVLPK